MLSPSADTRQPSLIVVPRGILEQWNGEFEKHAKDVVVNIIRPKTALTWSAWSAEVDVHLISHQTLLSRSKELKATTGTTRPTMFRLIIDEPQNFLQSSASRATQYWNAVSAIGRERSVALTATPIGKSIHAAMAHYLADLLRLDPFARKSSATMNGWYTRMVENGYANRNAAAVETLVEVIGKVMIREDKTKTILGDSNIGKTEQVISIKVGDDLQPLVDMARVLGNCCDDVRIDEAVAIVLNLLSGVTPEGVRQLEALLEPLGPKKKKKAESKFSSAHERVMEESRQIISQRDRSKLQGSRPAAQCTTISEKHELAKEILGILARQDVWDALSLHSDQYGKVKTETLRGVPPFNNVMNKPDVDKLECPVCKKVPAQPCIYVCGHLTCQHCFETGGAEVRQSKNGDRNVVTKTCPTCATPVQCVPLENPRDHGRTPSKKGHAAIEALIAQQQYPVVLAAGLSKVVHPESTRVDKVTMNAATEEDFKATSFELLVGKETVTDGFQNSQGQLPVDEARTEVTIDGLPVQCARYKFDSPTSMTVDAADDSNQFELVLDATEMPDGLSKGGLVFVAPWVGRAIARCIKTKKATRAGKVVLLCEVIHGPELQSAPFKRWLALTTYKKDIKGDATMLDFMFVGHEEQNKVACMPTPPGAKVYWASSLADLERFCEVAAPDIEAFDKREQDELDRVPNNKRKEITVKFVEARQQQDVVGQTKGRGWHKLNATFAGISWPQLVVKRYARLYSDSGDRIIPSNLPSEFVKRADLYCQNIDGPSNLPRVVEAIRLVREITAKNSKARFVMASQHKSILLATKFALEEFFRKGDQQHLGELILIVGEDTSEGDRADIYKRHERPESKCRVLLLAAKPSKGDYAGVNLVAANHLGECRTLYLQVVLGPCRRDFLFWGSRKRALDRFPRCCLRGT